MEIINNTLYPFANIAGRINHPSHSLTLIVKGTFDLVPDNFVTPSSEQLFPTGDEPYADDEEGTGSVRYESDFAYFKPKADLLLVGSCHAPGGNPVKTCRVTFKAGGKSKSLGVVGNRYWKGFMGMMSAPEPFSKMDLRYENSFGGAGFAKNPIGKGFTKVKDKNGAAVRPIPNIEDIDNLISSSSNRPDPAGFGPLNNRWQERFKKVGTYKGSWLKEKWPWFPDNFDWGYFNGAFSDMQVEGYLKGDESLYFENLHPQHSKYNTKLPCLRVRCFLNEQKTDDTQALGFKEVLMNLDTLWVDMEAEKLVLVWRGVAPVKTEEYEEITQAYIVSEKLEEASKTVDYYKAAFIKSLSEEDEEEHFAEEKPEKQKEDMSSVDEEMAKAKQEMKKTMIAAGLDPDNLPPKSEEEIKNEARILKDLGYKEVEEPIFTRETVRDRIKRGESFAGEDFRGIDLSHCDMKGADLKKAILSGVSLKGSNLSEVDFTEANLAGADLTGATLKNAILHESDCTGTKLIGADLTEADITGAVFEKAVFENACLHKVIAKDTYFTEADLTGVDFIEANCEGADFSKAVLDRVNFSSASLKEASVEGACGQKVNMDEADLTELRACGCNFTNGSFKHAFGLESIWEKAILIEVDFTYSKMEGADFTEANLKKANLSYGEMKFSRFTKANLKEARLIYTNLFQASLEKADLSKSNLRGANMYEVEFLGSLRDEAHFEYANLKMTKLNS